MNMLEVLLMKVDIIQRCGNVLSRLSRRKGEGT